MIKRIETSLGTVVVTRNARFNHLFTVQLGDACTVVRALDHEQAAERATRA